MRTRRATLIAPLRRAQRDPRAAHGRRRCRGAQRRIELASAIDGRPGAPLDKGGARTRGDGRFTLILPRNSSSRTLLLRYRSHANDTVAAAEKTLGLKVRVGIRLSVSPHVATRGRSVTLSGRLVGRPLPEGRQGGRAAGPQRGRAVDHLPHHPGIAQRTVRHALHLPPRRAGVYQMRVRVRAADDYPYATGTSRVVRVRVL